MPWLTIALLLLFGLLFVAVEVIFIPGTTLVGFVGFALLVVGVWMGYRDFGAPVGHYALLTVAVLASLIVYVGLRPKNLAKVALNTVNNADRVRPAGTALFGEERREVVTRGEFVASGSDVRVLGIEQNRIVVSAV